MGNLFCHDVSDCKSDGLIDVYKYYIPKNKKNLAVYHSNVYFLDYTNVVGIDNPILELYINCADLNINKKILKQKYSLPITEYNLMDWILDIVTNQLYLINLDTGLFYIKNTEIIVKKHIDKQHYVCSIDIARNIID